MCIVREFYLYETISLNIEHFYILKNCIQYETKYMIEISYLNLFPFATYLFFKN